MKKKLYDGTNRLEKKEHARIRKKITKKNVDKFGKERTHTNSKGYDKKNCRYKKQKQQKTCGATL